MKQILTILAFLGMYSLDAVAQHTKPVQFSGLVITEESGRPIPIPYVNVYIKNKNRGTFSNFEGFYSFVVEPGDTLMYSAIGFRTYQFVIPDTLTMQSYTYSPRMELDTVMLQEAVVFPWPSKEFLKQEFLAMDVSSDLEDILAENLSKTNMEKIRAELAYDGGEFASYYLRKQTQDYSYAGQLPPNAFSLFNPLAWIKFVQALRNGSLKDPEKKK